MPSLAEIDRLFRSWDTPSAPGGAVAVIESGEVVHRQGYGSADVAAAKAFTPSTQLSIASITKQFTCACVLLLENAGVLSLDDDVRKHYPELADFGVPLTLRHLCHNTSGIRDVISLHTLAGGQLLQGLDRTQIYHLLVGQRTLQFAPGSEYRYSNSNFFILAEIIERLADASFATVLRERIFQPLGMKDTLLVSNPGQPPENAATGYQGNRKDGFLPWSWDMWMSGEGGIWSTLDDMILWERNFDTPCAEHVGIMSRLATTTPLSGGTANDYAMGLQTGSYRGVRYESHGGGFTGFMSQRTRFPDPGLSIILFANHTQSLAEKTFRIADVLLNNAEPIEQPVFIDTNAPEIQERLGYYQDESGGLGFELGVDGESLTLGVMGLTRSMRAETVSTFRANLRSMWNGRLELGALEPVPSITVRQEQGSRATARLDANTIPPATGFEGMYENSELNVTYVIAARNGELHVTCIGSEAEIAEIPLRRKGRSSFVPAPQEDQQWNLDFDVTFWFPTGSKNRIDELVVSTNGAENNRYMRVR